MAARQVRALLMGGQACVFYGAAEFSRDTDLVVLAEPENLQRLGEALADLHAECIAVPAFRPEFLSRGHAIHFRCHHPDATGIRVDIMSTMRNVSPFPVLWNRRTSLTTADGMIYELLSLPDLVLAKKTQRDKDWPMVRRLVESDYLAHRSDPTKASVRFWLRELRTPELLVELAAVQAEECTAMVPSRPLLRFAAGGQTAELESDLADEERLERANDRAYWAPLKAELERLRHEKS